MGHNRRQNLWKEQHGFCFWCRRQCHLGGSGRRMFTVDHLIHRMDPIRKTEGWYKLQRTVGACASCNRRRGDEDMLRFARAALPADNQPREQS